MFVHVSAISFVRIDVPVNRFWADLQSSFQFKPISDLFWAEVCTGQSFHFGPFIRCELFTVDTGLLALITKSLSLLGPPTALPFVSTKLS